MNRLSQILVSINSGLTFMPIVPTFRYYDLWDIREVYPQIIQEERFYKEI